MGSSTPTKKFRYKRHPPHEPVPRCAGNGLLSPALSSRGGEGEDSGASKVRGFKPRFLSGNSLPGPLIQSRLRRDRHRRGNSNSSPVTKVRCHYTSLILKAHWNYSARIRATF